MTANSNNTECCICSTKLFLNSRLVFPPTFHVKNQPEDVLQRSKRKDTDHLTCFTKISRLSKIDFDLEHKLASFRAKKRRTFLVQCVPRRKRFLYILLLQQPRKKKNPHMTHQSREPRKLKHFKKRTSNKFNRTVATPNKSVQKSPRSLKLKTY